MNGFPDETERKNLKGSNHTLKYFKTRPTGKKVPRTRTSNGEVIQYEVDEVERIYFDEEYVRKFSLDKHGVHIPYVDSHLTIINNYMFDYWGYYLGPDGIALYGHLKRFCYGDKDYCFPNLDLIAAKMGGKSKNKIRDTIAVLENYGFVTRFYVQNVDKKNTEETPIYKIRKKVPFLSQSLIDGLPKILRDDHEKYIAEIIYKFDSQVDLDERLYIQELQESIIAAGNPAGVKKSTTEQQSIFGQRERLLREVSQEEQDIWSFVLSQLQQELSEVSFNTWFENTFCLKRYDSYYIYATNEMAPMHIPMTYKDKIVRLIAEKDPNFNLDIVVQYVF